MKLKRVLIELEVLYDEDLAGDLADETLQEIWLSAEETETCVTHKLVKDETCTRRRMMLLLKAQQRDDVSIGRVVGILPEPGTLGLRPTETLLELARGIDDDVKTLHLQEEDSTARADLDFLIGTLQQMPQDVMRDLLGEDLIFHQVDIVAECMRLIEDHGGDCLVQDLPASQDEPPMRTVMIQAFQEGMGPKVTLSLWDARRLVSGKNGVRYRLSSDGEIIFDAADMGCSPLHAIDSIETMRACLGFLTCRPSEMEDEFSADYTPRQREWAEEYGEALSIYALDDLDEGEIPRFDWDSFDEIKERQVILLSPENPK